jgi:hypothetical protein
MLDALILWLDQVRSTVFWLCAIGLVTVDLGAVAVVMATRSRALVNRWTGPVLAANLFLLGAGLGVPVAALAAKLVANSLAPVLSAPAAPSSKAAQLDPPSAPASEQLPSPPAAP